MRHVLGLEFISHDKYYVQKKHPKEFLSKLSVMPISQLTRTLSMMKKKPWVAEIVSLGLEFKFERKFLHGQVDYAKASGTGSRGVYLYFILEENKIYEVFAHRSWKNNEKYFVRFNSNGEEKRLTESEVIECLKQSLNSKKQ